MGAIEPEVIETWDKRDGRGRKLRQVERRAGFVRAYHSSGLTMAGFARREGLKYLRDVLTRLPALTNHDDLSSLLPVNWSAPAAPALIS